MLDHGSRSLETSAATILIAANPPNLGLHRVRLGCAISIVHREESVMRFVEHLEQAIVVDPRERLAEPEEKIGPFDSLVGTDEAERAFVKIGGGREAGKRHRAVACSPKALSRATLEVADVGACGTREVERVRVMVREHFCVIFGTPERVDPLGDTPVLRRPIGARDLSVGDVTDEDVQESVFRLVRHRRPPRPLDEALSLE